MKMARKVVEEGETEKSSKVGSTTKYRRGYEQIFKKKPSDN